MTTAVQHRRGTTAEHATFTGLEGEVTIDTTKDTAVIHDGILAGGVPLARENLANVTPSGLPTITGASTASDDKFFIYDQSATTLKSITRAELNNAMEADALANVTITGGSVNGTTIGATTASSGAFTTLAASGAVTLSGGTANGVPYLNGSKVLTSGSALTFDGTNFSATGTTTVNSANSSQVSLVVKGETGNGIRQNFIGQASSGQYNWQIGASITAAGYFAIIPSTAVDGTTFSTAAYSITGTGTSIWTVAGSEQMRLTSTGLEAKGKLAVGYSDFSGLPANGAAFAGSVGIGDSSPTEGKLTIRAGNAQKALFVEGYYAGEPTVELYRDNTDAQYVLELRHDGPVVGSGGTGYHLNCTDRVGSVIGYIKSEGVGTGSLYIGSNNFLRFDTNGTTRATLDSAGNLGLGVTPSGWNANFRAFEIGRSGNGINSDTTSNFFGIWSNAYYDSVGYKYGVTGSPSAHYSLYQGAHSWYTAPSGTAGDPISFTQAMTLDASGNLFVGWTPTGSGAAKFAVKPSSTYASWVSVGFADATAYGLEFGLQPGHGSYRSAVRGLPENYGGTDYGALAFYTSNSYNTGALPERMRINSGGQVIINNGSTVLDTALLTINCTAGTGSTTPLSLRVGVDSDGYGALTFRNQSGIQGTVACNTNNISISGVGGITFKATQVPSSDANTLDDYEEGTWTPGFTLASGSVSGVSSSGTYIKIGRQVTLTLFISFGTSSSGAIDNITNYPFPAQNTNDSAIGSVRENSNTGYQWHWRANNNDTLGVLRRYDNAGGISSGMAFVGTLTYFTV